jgi:cytidylate kinase
MANPATEAIDGFEDVKPMVFAGIYPIESEDFEAVLANVKERDERDTNRVESPLKQAHDALLIDNSLLTKTEQRDLLRKWFDEKTR